MNAWVRQKLNTEVKYVKKIKQIIFGFTHCIAVKQENSMGIAISFQTHVEWLETI